jgi:NAD(P)-dependent dehydrogenase (short-subunit alcohol dehydrogenase family)
MIAQALAVNGARVYIVGRTSDKLERAAEAHGKDIQGEIIPLTGDITKKDEIAKLVEQIGSKEKSLDILVNNAGQMSNTHETVAKTADEMKSNLFENKDATFDEWSNTYLNQVPHIYFMSTAFLPLLAKSSELHQGWSAAVVNITSISGMVKVMQHHPAYNSAKAAAIHLNRMLASEIASNGLKIRVNGLAPGVFPSEMTAEDSDETQKSHIPKDKYADKIAAARPGKDEDMAQTVLFMVATQYLNGQNVAVDGGYTLAAGL